MPRNGSGTYQLPAGNPVVTGTVISSTTQNTTMSDVATALTNSLAKDGQTTPTSNLPMGGFKHTGAGDATATGQYIVYGQDGISLGDTTIAGTLTVEEAATFESTAAFEGDVTMTAATMKWAKGADVASATALPLINDGNYFDVTGTTTITSFDSLGVGSWIGLHFDGALTLTHNATDLVLPGGANITTAAGDEAIFVEYSSGDWRCVSYTRASGEPLIAGGMTVSAAQATTSGTAIDFNSGFPANPKRVTLKLAGVSLNGTANPLIQLFDSGGVVTSGYSGSGSLQQSSSNVIAASTAGLIIPSALAANVISGNLHIELLDSATNTYSMSGVFSVTGGGTFTAFSGSSVTLSSPIAGVRLTNVAAANTFDAGKAGITIED